MCDVTYAIGLLQPASFSASTATALLLTSCRTESSTEQQLLPFLDGVVLTAKTGKHLIALIQGVPAKQSLVLLRELKVNPLWPFSPRPTGYCKWNSTIRLSQLLDKHCMLYGDYESTVKLQHETKSAHTHANSNTRGSTNSTCSVLKCGLGDFRDDIEATVMPVNNCRGLKLRDVTMMLQQSTCQHQGNMTEQLSSCTKKHIYYTMLYYTISICTSAETLVAQQCDFHATRLFGWHAQHKCQSHLSLGMSISWCHLPSQLKELHQEKEKESHQLTYQVLPPTSASDGRRHIHNANDQ